MALPPAGEDDFWVLGVGGAWVLGGYCVWVLGTGLSHSWVLGVADEMTQYVVWR